jgi:hypothetical protein
MSDSSFFDSSIVQEAIEEIVDLQHEIMIFSQYADYATLEQQKENLKVLRRLHEKQKNMCFRCVISKDDDAKILLGDVMAHFRSYGHIIDEKNPLSVFDEVGDSLDDIERDLDYCERHGHFPPDEYGNESPPFGWDPTI